LPVVDPAGNTLQLKMYSYPLVPITLGAPSLDDYDAVFPKGTILAIKEPRITLYSDYQDEACIRVDCPHDIVILDQKSFEDLIGNENIGNGFSPISTPEKDFITCKDEGNGVSLAEKTRARRLFERAHPGTSISVVLQGEALRQSRSDFRSCNQATSSPSQGSCPLSQSLCRQPRPRTLGQGGK
jgi:hypothetical protein